MTSDVLNLQIAEEAADWAVRLDGGPLDEEERRKLADWLRTSPVHVGELLQSCALLSGIGQVSSERTPTIDSLLEEIAPEVIPLFGTGVPVGAFPAVEPADGEEEPPAGRPAWMRFAALAASLAALVALGLTVALYRPGGTATAVAYATGIGEQRSIVLEDGSVVSMNADSSLNVTLTNGARDIELLSGEALFSVAHDPERPFRVYSTGTLVQAVGTEFLVKRRGTRVEVVVIDGKVLVDSGVQPGEPASEPAPGETALYLEGGQEIIADPATGLSAVTAADLMRATSWRERELSFSNEPLGMIVAEFNRYNRNKLEVEGADLAETRFSGVFKADDPESFVSFLEHSAAVHVDRLSSGRVILSSRP